MSDSIFITSQVALVVARILLAAVFVLAGVAKLADRTGFRQTLVAFGLPPRLTAPLGILTPLAELTLALAVLGVSSAHWGAVGALALLTVFTAAISVTLSRGKAPACRCFGQLAAAPVGPRTLMRNGALIATAAFIGFNPAGPGPSLVMWFGGLTSTQRVASLGGVLGFALLAVEAALLLQILKQQGRILLRLDKCEIRPFVRESRTAGNEITMVGLPIGSLAPGFSLPGLRGETVTLEELVAGGRPVLLLFTNPHCGPCQALLPEIGRWQREHVSKLSIAVVSEGTPAENRAKTAGHGVDRVLLQRQREVADTYQAWGTPAAVLLGPDGTIDSPTVQGADAIRALVARSLGTAPDPAAIRVVAANGLNGNGQVAPLLRVGDPAPAVSLRNINGETISLNSPRRRETLVLFWNPACGFCQRMLNDLREWDANPPGETPGLVVVSTGNVEEGRAMGLRSPVLIDLAHEAAGAFGATGTPMAVLLGPDGRILSEIAAGAQAVFALANAEPANVHS